jgi:hypothetical protein
VLPVIARDFSGEEPVRTIPLSRNTLNPLKRTLAFAAVVEIGTGLVLMIVPALVVTLLLGMDVSGAGILLGRCFGIAVLSLGVACWPGGQHAGNRGDVALQGVRQRFVFFGAIRTKNISHNK